MNVALLLLVSVILTLDMVRGVYGRLPKDNDANNNNYTKNSNSTNNNNDKLKLKCIPGRTVIRIEEDIVKPNEDSEEEQARRTHTNVIPISSSNDTCKICVCSVEGKDEYCLRRPARNVNECIRLALLKKALEKNIPFSHDRSLSYRIRRDYIWHYDEIPYPSKATCVRGSAYYTNNPHPNETNINLAEDVESLLDYDANDVCFYCVCTLDGMSTACMTIDLWFCSYYRMTKKAGSAKEYYKKLFKQDRPSYFQQLTYRLRRTMDDGMNALMDVGGDTLCCDHPAGHRRNLHEHIRNKIRMMRRKVLKENILAGSPRGDYVDFIVNND